MRYPIPDNINRFLRTPYFEEYVGSSNIDNYFVFIEVSTYIENSSLIGTIYPDVSFYCLQTYKKILCMVNYGKYLSDPGIHQWLKETFPPDMFLGMLNSYYENNGLNELIITLDGIFSKIVELITEKIDVLIPEQCDLANLHNLISNSCLD